jgi:TPR repeat protein
MHLFQYSHALLMVVFISTTVPVAHAQTAEVDTSVMSPTEIYQYAEALRLGRGVDVDPEKSLALHTQLAQTGRAQSFERMSAILFAQNRLEEAKVALEAGRDAGSELARMRLATGHVQQRFGTHSDPELGVEQLVKVTQNLDNANALYVLARAYEDGTGTNVQLDKSRAIYENLASEGHGPSIRRLGDFAREGTFSDPDLIAAADYYRSAAENGFDYSWVVLAKLSLDLGEYQQAMEAYKSAISANVAGASAAYARAHFLGEFGPLSDRAFGANELETNAESGDVYAAAEALELWERRSRRINSLDLEGVLDMLDTKMRAGDELATVSLARAYRVLRWRIPQSRARHAELVQDFGDQLGRARVREVMYFSYDPGRHAQSRQAAYEMISSLNGEEFSQAARALRATEMTAFVFLLQKELGDLGYYRGSESSVFNSATLRATMNFCKDQGISDTCVHGPLTYPASIDIIRKLTDARG